MEQTPPVSSLSEQNNKEKAKNIVSARVEGQELIAVAQDALSAEVKAAAAVVSSREAQRQAREQWIAAGREVGNVMKANLLVAVGRELSDDDLNVLEAVADGGFVTAQEAQRALVEQAKQKKTEVAQKRLAKEARGALPKIDLKDDLKMVNRMESLQQRQIEHGLAVLDILKRDPMDIYSLEEANIGSSKLSKAGEKLEKVTDGLVNRLSQRFP